MQIYRKCRHYSDWCAEGVFADTWKSWGFIDAYTGEEIQPNEEYHGEYSLNLEPFALNKTYWYYKWKYDTVDSYNHFLFTNGFTSNVNTRYTWLGFNLSNKQYFTGIDSRGYVMDSNYDSISNRLTYLLGRYGQVDSSTSRFNANYFNLFFIPLKNNGFFFNYESSCGASSSGDTSGRGLPIELSTYYKQTSPLLWDLYSYSHISNYSGSATRPRTSNATVIGFYNNIDNQMNYIKMVIPDIEARSYDTDKPKACYVNWDYKKNSISTSISCMDEDGSYTDVKENICTLIKYPYETGALSNLFIISTCPERKTRQFVDSSVPDYIAPDSCGLEGKFFSFNGRNFYGFYNNLAVELPSN